MPAQTLTPKQVIEYFVQHFSGHPKPNDLLTRYISSPALLEHIRETEAAFPSYRIDPEQVVAEGDLIALRGTFSGTHTGTFHGMPPTGKHVSLPVAVFYRFADGLIAEHWLLFDTAALMSQLTA